MSLLFFLAEIGSTPLIYIAAVEPLKERLIKTWKNTEVEYWKYTNKQDSLQGYSIYFQTFPAFRVR